MRVRCLILLLVFAFCGCGTPDKSSLVEKQQLRVEEAGRDKSLEASALSVCGQRITCGEVIEPLIEKLRPIAKAGSFEQFGQYAKPAMSQALADKISYILLYEKAKKEYGERLDPALKKNAENEISKFVARYGGDYEAAEEAIRQRGMDWDAFEQLQKRLILISMEMPEARPISYWDLVDCYERIKAESFAIEGTITIRLIDIEADKVQPVDPNRSRLELARELADSLRERIRNGDDFAVLARAYSHGHRREFGGLWPTIRPESLARPYDLLADAAERMEPGEVAGPLETNSPTHIFVMKLEDEQARGYKPLGEVQRQVGERILFERRRDAAVKLETRLAQQAAMAQSREFVNLCVEKAYSICRQ